MRISIIQGDPDFVADGKRYIVKLDGVVQRDCIIVDTDKQLIVRYKRNKVGLLCKGWGQRSLKRKPSMAKCPLKG